MITGDSAATPARSVHAGPPASARLGIGLGVELAFSRLRARRPLLALALGAALALAAALVEGAASAAGAVDRALLATFRLAVPLTTFALAADASDRSTLREAAWPVARFGVSSRAVALGIAAAAALAAASAGALLAAIAVVAAHSPSAPPLVRDLLASAWIGALSGAAYAGWFSLGGTFLRRGLGRVIPLVADFVFGGAAGAAGALLPQGNAVNLLGGPGPLGLSPQASAGALGASALVLAIAAALRCRD